MPHIKVELDILLGLERSWAYGGKYVVRLLCAFEDREMVVIWAKEGVFELDLSSMKSKKFRSRKRWCTLHPYIMTPG